MSPWLAGGILIGFIAWTVGVGYESYNYGTDKMKAEDASALVAEQLQHKKDQAAADAKAVVYEAKIAKANQQTDELEKQMEDLYAKVADNCDVPADLIRMRNQAAGR